MDRNVHPLDLSEEDFNRYLDESEEREYEESRMPKTLIDGRTPEARAAKALSYLQEGNEPFYRDTLSASGVEGEDYEGSSFRMKVVYQGMEIEIKPTTRISFKRKSASPPWRDQLRKIIAEHGEPLGLKVEATDVRNKFGWDASDFGSDSYYDIKNGAEIPYAAIKHLVVSAPL